MISGSITPISIGLKDEKTIVTLLYRSNLLFKWVKIFVEYYIFALGFVIYFFPLAINFTLVEVIVFAVPNTMIFQVFILYSYSFLLYKVVYLYLLCYYLKAKIIAIDSQVVIAIKFSRFERLRQLIRSYTEIYAEVIEYNTTFWSKYLFIFWLTFGSVIVFMQVLIFFTPLPLMYKLTWICGEIALSGIFSIVILSVSSVNSVANKSYKSMNKLFIHYSNVNRRRYVQNFRRVCNKIKVIL